MGAMQRRKGVRFEKEVAVAFRAVLGEAKRGLGQMRNAGEVADVDVEMFWPECKVGQRTNPKAALKQARAASASSKAGRGKIPIAVCRDDREEATVTLSLHDFLRLVHGFLNNERGAPTCVEPTFSEVEP